MPTGTLSDFQINPVLFRVGMLETLGQNGIAFNALTNNTILFAVQSIIGQITKKDYFKRISNLVSARDPTSVAAAAVTKLEQGTQKGVKVDRRVGPVEQTIDSLRKIGATDAEVSLELGRQLGEELSQDYFNAGLLSTRAALTNAGAANSVEVAAVGGAAPLITDHLQLALAKMGDAANRIRAWVMHSAAWNSLIDDQLQNWKIDSVAGQIIYGATPATFNRPVIVSDSASLFYDEDLGGGLETVYETLGLVEGAASIVESQFEDPLVERVGGLENLVWRFQTEYSFNLEIKGAGWDDAGGGVSPNNTALGTAVNWDSIFSNHKDRAGVRIKHN